MTTGPDEAVCLPGERIHQRRTDIQQHPAGQLGATDRTHTQVLLLGQQPA